MPIFRPSELHAKLEKLNKKANKTLSQNFLIDGNVVNKIITAASVQENETILEIGPGPGALTEALLARKVQVIAIEKDPIFAAALKAEYGQANLLHVFEADALEFPLEETLRSFLKQGEKAKVVASLPYHIATPIVTKLVTLSNLISSLTVVIQKELAERYVAKPKTAEYSSITLFLGFYSDINYNFSIKNSSFFPPPKVTSAVVTLRLKSPPQISSPDLFLKTMRAAFQQRRKTLRVSLQKLYPSEKIEAALKVNDQSPLTRPEELSLPDFINFFKELQK